MKFTHCIAAVFILTGSNLIPRRTIAASVTTPDPSHSGWLEGRVLTPDGKPVWGRSFVSTTGIHVQGTRQGGGEFDVVTDTGMGGLYKVQNLRPGVYTVTVPGGFGSGTTYCPQRIFGVVVKPETRSILDITCDQGDTLVETGKPNVESERIIPLAVKLEQLESEVAALREQIKVLKERLDLVDNSGKPMAR